MDRICEVLDPQVIRQQAEQGVLDFKSYANFIIQLLAKSCAPVRDEEVAKLNDLDDVVLTFRRILEVMDLMKLDMANCLLEAARREVITHSVEYEKHKFNELLKLYTGNLDSEEKIVKIWITLLDMYSATSVKTLEILTWLNLQLFRIPTDGFPETEKWLKRNLFNDTNDRNAKAVTLLNAYMEFLDWNPENEYPETIAMDIERLQGLVGRALKLCILASTIAIASSVTVIGQQAANRKALTDQIEVLLQNVNTEK